MEEELQKLRAVIHDNESKQETAARLRELEELRRKLEDKREMEELLKKLEATEARGEPLPAGAPKVQELRDAIQSIEKEAKAKGYGADEKARRALDVDIEALRGRLARKPLVRSLKHDLSKDKEPAKAEEDEKEEQKFKRFSADGGPIQVYEPGPKWRKLHPLPHLAIEEGDVSKWAFPDNAD